jgi:carnitine O-palmitoyltransferase 2
MFISVLLTEFKVDDKAKVYISQGKKNYETFCKSLNISYIEVLNYGRKDCKKFKVSPDSIMQLAFQVREMSAFYEIYITNHKISI